MELFKLVGELSQRHRYSGTENEEWACQLLADRMKEVGCEVELEDTTYIKSELYRFLIGSVSTCVLFGFVIASGFVHSLLIGFGMIGFIAFMAILYPRIELNLTKAKSTNIIGRINPGQDHRLVLTAHYDSAKVLPRYILKFYDVFRWVESILSLLMLLFIGLLLGRGLWMLIGEGFALRQLITVGAETGLMEWPWSPVWWFYLVMMFAMASLSMAIMAHMMLRREYSKGADDNASGTAILLEVANRLGKEDLAVGIDLCLFAAEERGLFGSRKWVSKHAKDMDKKRTYVLNLDCVGRGEQFFINNGQGAIFKKRSDPQIVRLLQEACEELGLQHNLCWGGNTDHYEFVKRRFRCASLLRCDVDEAILPERILDAVFHIPTTRDVSPRLIWIHSEDDTGEHIDKKKLEETADLAELFVRKLSKEVAQGELGAEPASSA